MAGVGVVVFCFWLHQFSGDRFELYRHAGFFYGRRGRACRGHSMGSPGLAWYFRWPAGAGVIQWSDVFPFILDCCGQQHRGHYWREPVSSLASQSAPRQRSRFQPVTGHDLSDSAALQRHAGNRNFMVLRSYPEFIRPVSGMVVLVDWQFAWDNF